MRISRKSLLQSSHDFILILCATIAIVMMVSSLRHHLRFAPTGLGMVSATTAAV